MRRRSPNRWAHRSFFVIACATVGIGCGRTMLDDGASAEGGAGSTVATSGHGGQGGKSPVVTVLMPNAPPLPGQTECKVVITDDVPFEGHNHLTVCTPITYKSNPPSSGDHWPIWAAFTTYDKPVPREMLVHDLEHGAVVMAYKCPGACPDVTAAFEKAASDFGPDPICLTSPGNAKRSRIVVTPDPKLAAPIGLSAWQATYTATCIDPPSLLAFIKGHYDRATEHLCVEGRDPSDPATGVPSCQGI